MNSRFMRTFISVFAMNRFYIHAFGCTIAILTYLLSARCCCCCYCCWCALCVVLRTHSCADWWASHRHSTTAGGLQLFRTAGPSSVMTNESAYTPEGSLLVECVVLEVLLPSISFMFTLVFFKSMNKLVFYLSI